MSRVCPITQRSPMSGHHVSHANNKVKRRFLVNLQSLSFKSSLLGRSVKLRVSARGLRTIEKYGGFDEYLLKVKKRKASGEMLKLKKAAMKRQASGVSGGNHPASPHQA